eukprot:scaffold21897_cov59-Phaeocystis_antarctica.AAC.6
MVGLLAVRVNRACRDQNTAPSGETLSISPAPSVYPIIWPPDPPCLVASEVEILLHAVARGVVFPPIAEPQVCPPRANKAVKPPGLRILVERMEPVHVDLHRDIGVRRCSAYATVQLQLGCRSSRVRLQKLVLVDEVLVRLDLAEHWS